jgi:hypothetical protein
MIRFVATVAGMTYRMAMVLMCFMAMAEKISLREHWLIPVWRPGYDDQRSRSVSERNGSGVMHVRIGYSGDGNRSAKQGKRQATSAGLVAISLFTGG